MKKAFLIIFVFAFCFILLCGCGDNETPQESSSAADVSTKEDNENNNVDTGESGATDEKIETTVVEKGHNYYTKIKDVFYRSENIEFYYVEGNYFDIITSSSELESVIISPSVDPSIFEDNYVICISREGFGGYYDFKCVDGKYSISADTYERPPLRGL